MNRGKLSVLGGFIFLLLIVMPSCTKVDDLLGSDLIPEDQQMKMGIDTLFDINTYLVHVDTFATNNLQYGYIGAMNSPRLGDRRASLVTQFLPTGFPYQNMTFGKDILSRFDSITFHLTMNDAVGDTNVMQSFDIYEITKPLYRDSVYYSNFDASENIAPTPLFTISFKGKKTFEKRIASTELDPFILKLLDTTGSVYEYDSLYYKRNKGVYIVPSSNQTNAAELVSIDMAKSGFKIYYQSHISVDGQKSVDYTFDNSEKSPSTSINKLEYSYIPRIATILNDTIGVTSTTGEGYIQALGGVATYAKFTEEFVKKLRALITPGYSHMAINRATLIIGVNNPTTYNVNNYLNRLGMYSEYRFFTPIWDYNYTVEQSGGTLLYGGYINKTKNVYMMNITAIVQQMLISNEKGMGVEIAPDMLNLYSLRESIINGGAHPSNADPMKVEVTYTLIK